MELDDTGNLVLTLKDSITGKTLQVSLEVPRVNPRADYTLWTPDGPIDLGRYGSVMEALNAVLESFARKNRLECNPKFPVGQSLRDSRKAVEKKDLSSSWASLDGQRKPKKAANQQEGEDSSGSSNDELSLESGSDEFESGSYDEHDPNQLIGASLSSSARREDTVSGKLKSSYLFYQQLYGGDCGLYEGKDESLLRFVLSPDSFLNATACEVYQITRGRGIVLEFAFKRSSSWSSQPSVNCYQLKEAKYDLSEYKVPFRSFGLQWILSKRIEEHLKKIWTLSGESEVFTEVLAFASTKILHCSNNCIICDQPLKFEVLKPSLCDRDLCSFSYEQFDLGVDPATMIRLEPDQVDLLLSITSAVAQAEKPERFTPFPRYVERMWKDSNGKPMSSRFQQNPKNEACSVADCQVIKKLFEKMPSVQDMSQHCESSRSLRQYLDQIDLLAYPLLRWTLTSNTAHIAKLADHEIIQGTGTKWQFKLLTTSPAKEARFEAEKKKHGSFWAWHGSAWQNWHSIARNGLKNLSGSALMSAGQVYGAGIYLAKNSGTSLDYAKSGSGWSKSRLGGSGLQCLALCEVVNAGYVPKPYYVIPNEDHVVTRYLLVFNTNNKCNNVIADTLKIPPCHIRLTMEKPK